MPAPILTFCYLDEYGKLELFQKQIDQVDGNIPFSIPQKFIIVSPVTADTGAELLDLTNNVLNEIEKRCVHDARFIDMVQLKDYRLENEIYQFKFG